MTDDDTNEDAATHYFYDSDGHLYVDVTAVRERGRVELFPPGGGEVEVDFTQANIDKRNPVLNLPITQATDDRLAEWFGDGDGGEKVRDAKREVGHAIERLDAALEALDGV